MDMVLTRILYLDTGVFSSFDTVGGTNKAVALEHAYSQDDGTIKPKLPAGTYTCVRGSHQLASMTRPFDTFEVTNVPGHTGILFHMGNYNQDSDGCILLGESLVPDPDPTMITKSILTFNAFMASQAGVKQFTLVVK